MGNLPIVTPRTSQGPQHNALSNVAGRDLNNETL